MAKAIRTYLPVSLAIVALFAVASVASLVILQNQRLRIPILEQRPFELQAEFEFAQGVVPGQGQTVRVAGVRIGDVQRVELEDGVAVVTLGIDRDYLPIYRDATILLRPQTALKDMFFELDPGTRAAGSFPEGATVPLSNTAPDVTLTQILPLLDSAALDADSRDYLRIVAVELGRALEGRDRELARLLRGLGPITEDLERVNTTLAKRDEELARLIHNLRVLTSAVGERDDDLTELVDTSSEALGAVAEQAPDLRRFVRGLPGTLEEAQRALGDTTPFARELGPALDELRPFARRLDEAALSIRRLAERATPAIRERIRPFVRAARPALPDLGRAAERFAAAAPPLTTIARKVNRLGNMTAYNPRGAEEPGTRGRDEGYLYWLGWFAHNGVSVFGAQDAHGLYRRIYLTASCQNLRGLIESSPAGPAVGGLITGLAPLFGPGGECS